MKEEYFTASDGKKISCTLWDNADKPKAIVQLIHGMNEHIKRYDRFAKFLNSHRYIVFGDDHRGHGKTARTPKHIGKPDGEADLFSATVRDELEIQKMLKLRYNLPIILLGHSYGSFITQRYIELSAGHALTVLSGSAKYPYIGLAVCKAMAAACCKISSPENNADFIERFSFRKPAYRGGASWISRDEEQVKLYVADPYCNRPFSYGFYLSLFRNLMLLHKKDRPNINKSIPMLILSGGSDPVGGNTLFVKSLYNAYRPILDKVELKIYSGARHELLSELNFEEVQNDLLNFFDYNIQ